MKKNNRGQTLAELLVGSVLFTIFLGTSLSLFNGVSKLVNKDQGPSEQILEGRAAVMRVARRMRNCRAMLQPTTRNLILGSSSELLLRDRVLNRTVRLHLRDGKLVETQHPIDYDPQTDGQNPPLKQLYLSNATDFKVVGGGLLHPTRLNISLTLPDGREVTAVTNFREAI